MNDDLPDNIDLNIDLPEDSTKVVVENRELLSELRSYGLKWRKVGEILRNYHGLRLSGCYIGRKEPAPEGWVEFEDILGLRSENEPWPSKTKLNKYKAEHDRYRKDIDHAIRSAKGLLNNPYISSETKELLKEDVERLSEVKERESHKPFKDKLLHPDEADVKKPAKSISQMTGMQVVEVYKYINRYSSKLTDVMQGKTRKVKEGEIFSLICEIFNGIDRLKPYTREYIKSLYYNNL